MSDGAALAASIFERLMRGFEVPVALRLWDGIVRPPLAGTPRFTLVLRDPALLRRLVIDGSPLLLAEGYFRGLIDIEGDLYSALRLKDHFERLRLSWCDKICLMRDALRLPSLRNASRPGARMAQRFAHRHTQESDRSAISFHYDVSNAFYAMWLDAERVYSCGYFKHPGDSLDVAQRNKLEHVCRKLRLRPGDRLLDIGCGWGALVCWAARHHGARAHGITLSQRQFDFVRQRIEAEKLTGLVTVELRDFRDLPADATYDKISSIGMFEHVGLSNMPGYLATVQRVLRPGGLFLNHGITHDEEGWSPTLASIFINRYVFPDGELDCVSNIQRGMERAGFEIHDVEGLRPHYALTLRHWVARLEGRREDAIREVGEGTYRIWRLYMAACALEFDAGGTGVYQILASQRKSGIWPVPLTRSDLYADAARTAATGPVTSAGCRSQSIESPCSLKA
jgi:cyclopropane-fatty-acyl-phospholipid synthase